MHNSVFFLLYFFSVFYRRPISADEECWRHLVMIIGEFVFRNRGVDIDTCAAGDRCSLLTSLRRLLTAHHFARLLTAHHFARLLTAHCSLLSAHLFVLCSLLTAHCSPLCGGCSQLTAHLFEATAHSSLLAALCSPLCALLTAHSSLLTTLRRLLTAHWSPI